MHLLPLLFAATLLLGAASPAASQVQLYGRVVDEATGEGVESARVVLLDWYGRPVSTLFTDTNGEFGHFVRRHGVYLLHVTRAGYRETTSPRLPLGEHGIIRVELRLHTDVVLLAPLEVVARSHRNGSAVLDNFRARMESGMGTFVTRADIERQRPTLVTDVLATLPGVRLENAGGSGTRRMVFMRSGCPAQIYVDGFHINRTMGPGDSGLTVDDVISPGSVEGIEVYRGLATIPAEFLSSSSSCGVVAIWTRRGTGA